MPSRSWKYAMYPHAAQFRFAPLTPYKMRRTRYVGEMGVWVHNSECGGKAEQIKEACFAPDTPVITFYSDPENGKDYIRLEEIALLRVGDRVLSRNEQTGEMAFKQVLKCFEHYNKAVRLLEYIYDNNPKLTDSHIVTLEHPYWVEGKGWVKMADLKVGDKLITHNQTTATVTKMEDCHLTCVYNIEVEDFNTYFVGDFPSIWVHNCTDTPVDAKVLDASESPIGKLKISK